MSRSARINFGYPNSEFIVESDENGVAQSCRNVDTGIEYVGGGSSDFSTAEVTISGLITDPANVYMMPYVDPDYVEYGCTADQIYVRDEPYTLIVPLYQGKCTIVVGEDIVNSGSAVYDGDNGIVTITGDCSLKAKAY